MVSKSSFLLSSSCWIQFDMSLSEATVRTVLGQYCELLQAIRPFIYFAHPTEGREDSGQKSKAVGDASQRCLRLRHPAACIAPPKAFPRQKICFSVKYLKKHTPRASQSTSSIHLQASLQTLKLFISSYLELRLQSYDIESN